MSYIQTQTTPEQARQNGRDSVVLSIAEAVNHLATTMISGNQKFWAAEPVQLVEDLNANIETSVPLMLANTQLGAVLNDHLDKLDLPQYTKRVPLVIGNPNISFDGSTFVYTEPVIEESSEV